ncbi:hypothetical protein Q5H93_17945 [Hymenobacter sp. ASUV-10]|uniref:DUF4270 family protein n=1 Tax=Hymenobacter aranciens TaxID=3063996 RepID=A0ABT9BED6_9BACT|nr:hypothetical protein [Hymenobacter sp. ASUV-10]MDO7876633.1 hypothetical protein [Hymenobacter sp. ASUV-10]
MKKALIGLLLLASASAAFTSCKDEDKDPQPSVVSVPLFFPTLTTDSDTVLNLQRTRASDNALANLPNPTRPQIKFTINITDQRDVKIKAVQVYKSYRATSGASLGPRILAGEYPTFPTTVEYNSQEILTGLLSYTPPTPPDTVGTVRPIKGATASANNTVFSGSTILFTFEYVLEDGRHIILTPVNKINARLQGSTDPFKTYEVVTGTQTNAPYALPIVVRN